MAKHYYRGSNIEDYSMFESGVSSGREDPDVHAYFVGVGYGKGTRGDTHVGFSDPKQNHNFKRGVDNCNKHFVPYEVHKPWWKRLFSGEKSSDFARGRAKSAKKTERRSKREYYRKRNRKAKAYRFKRRRR